MSNWHQRWLEELKKVAGREVRHVKSVLKLTKNLVLFAQLVYHRVPKSEFLFSHQRWKN